MSAGQTGQMTGQMGHVHGTDGTQTRGVPPKFFMCIVFSRANFFYAPPPPTPVSGHEAFFRGGGWGCIF